uniref:Uncharacterized protein n=1 Tax=white sturgeon herpesvirus 2 TaxID=320884 RepID=A0A1I9KXY5_9VIRU|nr:hypothetical protein [Acipenserid herpesvirus 2]
MWRMLILFFTRVLKWLKTTTMALNWLIDPNDIDDCEGDDDWSDSWVTENDDDDDDNVELPLKMALLSPLKSYETIVNVFAACEDNNKELPKIKSILKNPSMPRKKHTRSITFNPKTQIFKYEAAKSDNVNTEYRQKCMFKMVAPQILTDPFNREGVFNFLKTPVENVSRTPTTETSSPPKLGFQTKDEDECIDLMQFLSEYSSPTTEKPTPPKLGSQTKDEDECIDLIQFLSEYC